MRKERRRDRQSEWERNPLADSVECQSERVGPNVPGAPADDDFDPKIVFIVDRYNSFPRETTAETDNTGCPSTENVLQLFHIQPLYSPTQTHWALRVDF